MSVTEVPFVQIATIDRSVNLPTDSRAKVFKTKEEWSKFLGEVLDSPSPIAEVNFSEKNIVAISINTSSMGLQCVISKVKLIEEELLRIYACSSQAPNSILPQACGVASAFMEISKSVNFDQISVEWDQNMISDKQKVFGSARLKLFNIQNNEMPTVKKRLARLIGCRPCDVRKLLQDGEKLNDYKRPPEKSKAILRASKKFMEIENAIKGAEVELCERWTALVGTTLN